MNEEKPMTTEQQKALEALQALHAENERLGLYKDAYAQSTTTQTQVRSTEEALKLAIKAMKSFQEGTSGLYEGEFDEEIKACEEALSTKCVAQPEKEPVAVYGYCPECGAKGVVRERRLNGNDICAIGHTYPSREAATSPQPKEQKQKPMAWIPIEQMYPQTKSIDILMGDGSILCEVLPQFNGDLWWEGSGTGEKFIDPKYANVTHWRIHGETTTPPPVPEAHKRKPWVWLSEENREQHRDSWRSNIHDQEIKAIEAKIRELNEAPQRTWIGLTDVEISNVIAYTTAGDQPYSHRIARAIEAKLKAKNSL